MMMRMESLEPDLYPDDDNPDAGLPPGVEMCLCCMTSTPKMMVMVEACADGMNLCIDCFLRAELGR
jgi:hypothetical protein